MFVFARGVPRQQKDREDLADGVTATLAYVCTELFSKSFSRMPKDMLQINVNWIGSSMCPHTMWICLGVPGHDLPSGHLRMTFEDLSYDKLQVVFYHTLSCVNQYHSMLKLLYDMCHIFPSYYWSHQSKPESDLRFEQVKFVWIPWDGRKHSLERTNHQKWHFSGPLWDWSTQNYTRGWMLST